MIISIILWNTSDITNIISSLNCVLNIPITTSSMSPLPLNFNLDDPISGNVLNLKKFKYSAIYIQSAMPQIIKDLKRLSHLSSEQIKITASQLSTGSNLDKKILNISFESHNGQNKILHDDFKIMIYKLIKRHDNNRKKINKPT